MSSGSFSAHRGGGGAQGAGQGGYAGGHGGGSFVAGAAGGFAGGAGGGFGGSVHGGQWDQAGHGHGHGHGEGLLPGGEKATMQNLNDRLAAYMENVNELENANSELERKIKEWYAKQHPDSGSGGAKDNSKYFQQIAELQAKVLAAQLDNASSVLQIDNARLACDDFKLKYENELMLRQCVEADINGLRRVMDDLTLCKSDMESELERLTEELAALKKNHEDEKKGQQGGAQGELNVEMQAAPGMNLLDVLNKTRVQYEKLAEENRQRAEDEFNKRSGELKKEISTGVEQVQSSKSEVSDLRRSWQALQIELQSQMAMKSSLESTLAETEGRYCSQLADLQYKIRNIEEQLMDLREQTEQQSEEYNQLLDTKTRLEQEIGTYQHLLESSGGTSGSQTNRQSHSGSGGHGSGGHSGSGAGSRSTGTQGYGSGTGSSSKEPVKTTRIMTITEDLIGGTVVSSKRQVHEQH